MKGKLPMFLRLTLVVILAVSFSLVPMAVNPQPAQALGATVTVAVAPNTPATAAAYTITGTSTAAWVAGTTTIIVTFPAGTTVPAGAPMTTAGNVTINGVATTAAQTVAGLVVTATVPAGGASGAAAAFTVVFLAAAGLVNPAVGTFTLTVATGVGPIEAAVTSSLYVIAANGSASGDILVQVGSSPNQPGATASYLATATHNPTIVANVGDNVTFRSTRGSAFAAFGTALSSATLAAGTGTATIAGNALPQPLPTASTTTVVLTSAGGTFGISLPSGASGTVISGTATVTGSPQTLAAGSNTITTAGVATNTFTIAVTLISTAGSGLRTLRTSDTYPAVALTDTVAAGTGTGDFSPGSQITVTIDGAAAATVPATSLVGLTTGATITDAGRGRFQTAIVIPALTRSTAGSPHVIKITDGSISRTVNLVLNQKVVFTPDHAAKDKDITITGSGFRGSNSIDVEIRNATTPFTGGTTSLIVSQGLLTTDASGSFTGVIKVPSVMVTANSINARDGGNATANAWNLNTELRTFLVDPSMTISPTSGLPGSQAVINGTELIPGSVITTLTIGGVSALASLSTTAVGAAGTANEGKLQSATVTLPIGLSPGKKSITLTGTLAATGANTSAGGSVTISALPLNISPTSGAVGRDVVLNMNNMAAGTAIAAGTTVASSVTVGGLPAITNAYTTDSGGNATVTVTIPTALTATGDQNVIVTVGATVATGTYTVKKPTMTLSPVDQIRNGTVNVSGSGWVSEKTVTIGIGAVGTVGATTISVTPGSDGKFASSFRVPTDFGSDTNNTISATDTVGNTMDPVNLHVTAPSIVVSPLVVAWGQTLTITGKGFRGGVNMRYELPWGTIATSGSFPTATYSDSTGSFTASLNMPTLSKGVRSIGVTDGVTASTATIEVQESAPTVQSALAPIAAQLVRVWGFDAASQTWKLYDPSVPAELNTLSALSKGSGYFINVKAATTITTGSGNIVSLSPGWQILGW